MTLYLARKVGNDHAVDETSTVYLGLCDDADCRHMVDHRDIEIVNDALDGHRRRAHPGVEAGKTGWLTFNGPVVTSTTTASPEPTVRANDPRVQPSPFTYKAGSAADPHMPSPTPRGEETP